MFCFRRATCITGEGFWLRYKVRGGPIGGVRWGDAYFENIPPPVLHLTGSDIGVQKYALAEVQKF